MKKLLSVCILLVMFMPLVCACEKEEKEDNSNPFLEGIQKWEEKVHGDDDANEKEKSWTDYTKQYFPDAEVEEDEYGGAIISVSLGEDDPDYFMFQCSMVLSKLEGCKDGTMVTINITDDPGACIVGFPNENGLFGFECTAILSEDSPLQESYDNMLGTNDRDFLKKEQELNNEIEKTKE